MMLIAISDESCRVHVRPVAKKTFITFIFIGVFGPGEEGMLLHWWDIIILLKFVFM